MPSSPVTHKQDADKFVKMVEVYVRGNSIKYVTIPEEVLDMVQEEDLSKESECHRVYPSVHQLHSSTAN